MPINKVDYGGRTLVDLTDSTVTAEDLMQGIVAYDKAGNRVIGTLVGVPVDTAMSDVSENAVQNKVIKAYVDGKADTFIAQPRVTTLDELSAAYQAGKEIVLRAPNGIGQEMWYTLSMYVEGSGQLPKPTFIFTEISTTTLGAPTYSVHTWMCDKNGWQSGSGSFASRQYVDDAIPAMATETEAGIVKLNPAESVTLNASGQLQVGGRLGQFPNGGVFYPTTITPENVGSSSFLMTDGAKGASLATRSLAILAGANITCRSAAAGATQYRVKNTFANRFACSAVKGGRAALSQAEAANGTAKITSIKFANGNDVFAYFGPEETSNDIIITVDQTINPNAATTTIRCYGTNSQSDNILIGQGVGANGGKCISLGQSTYAAGNQTVALGNAVHVMANNSAGFGHSMLINKQYCFGAGQGHDFSSGVNGTSAVGTWSEIGGKTKFAVGNGTAFNARSNVFEVQDNAGATELIIKSPNGTKFKLTIDDSGNLSTAAV